MFGGKDAFLNEREIRGRKELLKFGQSNFVMLKTKSGKDTTNAMKCEF